MVTRTNLETFFSVLLSLQEIETSFVIPFHEPQWDCSNHWCTCAKVTRPHYPIKRCLPILAILWSVDWLGYSESRTPHILKWLRVGNTALKHDSNARVTELKLPCCCLQPSPFWCPPEVIGYKSSSCPLHMPQGNCTPHVCGGGVQERENFWKAQLWPEKSRQYLSLCFR